jgi:Fuc2NAc and GlcNAc transferase
MIPEWVVLAAVVFALSLAGTEIVRRRAIREHWLDVPNERSSHSEATPRGGGVAVVVAASLGFLALWMLGAINGRLAAALLAGGGVVAAVGFRDDRRPVSAGVRLAVHLGAATFAVAALGGVPPVRIGERLLDLGAVGHVLGVIAIAWTLNLFNFMDGIDGIAASQAVFVAVGAAVVAVAAGTAGANLVPPCAVIAAAAAGFLVWNWPPARIFMGDAGSGYLGYVIAVLALFQVHRNAEALFIWLILGAAFFVDATVTLLARLLRGERIHEPHRTHAYQRLSRRWGSHRKVTVALLLANLAWSLPLAWIAAGNPRQASVMAAAALLPWIVVAAAAGAGRRDTSPSR